MISKEGLRKLLILAILAAVPLYCFLFSFACGFLSPSQNFEFQSFVGFLIPMMLFGPPAVTGIVAFIQRTRPKWRHFAICGALYVAVGAAFIAPPGGAVKWTFGLSLRVLLTKDPVRIQQWATEVLARYKSGKLETKPESEKGATGKALLAEREIPQHIQTLWREKPSIGILTMTSTGDLITPAETDKTLVDSPGGPSTWVHCVAFSWYINGILV